MGSNSQEFEMKRINWGVPNGNGLIESQEQNLFSHSKQAK